LRHEGCRRALPVVVACLAMAAVAGPAAGETLYRGADLSSASLLTASRTAAVTVLASQALQPSAGSATNPSMSGTSVSVACMRPSRSRIRCTMTIRGGAGISGTVRMRITRRKLLVALGHGRIRHGTAALTMRVLHRMSRGRYTVAMVLTIQSTRVLLLG
jgi:hypothetical protein